jgi:hypothetical protein
MPFVVAVARAEPMVFSAGVEGPVAVVASTDIDLLVLIGYHTTSLQDVDFAFLFQIIVPQDYGEIMAANS